MKNNIGKSDEEIKQMQDNFGFVDGKTCCAECGVVLTRGDCWWAFGRWWHNTKSSCKLK